MNIPKVAKDLYSKNCKTLVKEMEDDTNRWNDIPHTLTGRLNIVKMITLPKTIFRFSAIPIRLAMVFFTELEQKISQFAWKHKRPQTAKAILRKKNGARGINFQILDYITKLQSSRQYGTGIKPKIQTNGTR